MEDLKNTSTIQLIKDLTYTERKMELLLIKREIIRTELVRRMPYLVNQHEFQPMELTVPTEPSLKK